VPGDTRSCSPQRSASLRLGSRSAEPRSSVRLADKVAIVTGAGRGIGAATARRFAHEGAAVCCVDRDARAVDETVADLRARGGNAISLVLDVSQIADNEVMVQETVRTLGGLDILHANAATALVAPLDDTSQPQWRALVESNIYGVANGIASAVPELRKRGGGSVIITSSVVAFVGDAEMPAYSATKGAVSALCRSLAVAYGPSGIRVNTVCPGDVETEMLDRYLQAAEDPSAARAAMIASYPLGRFASPDDIAAAATFLASDDSCYVTGTELRVDGGLLAGIY
jgi:NAD(P)-dependent dehydrogenase (short-subunit alcohol dehydrogenase family)